MAVNLSKNREAILQAYNSVLDSNTKTDWALFSYDGQSNDLKVVGTGDGGLTEVMEDLNSGKIMYVFMRISDPKTSIKKNVLINWQGEGAPVLRKGACSNHIRDVSKLLSGAHLTVNARTEDDIDEDKILLDLNLRGTAINAQDAYVDDSPRAPVGTVYNRVIPTRDINSSERDEFWRKEEEEERKRLEIEREKKRQDQLKAEEERKRQEATAAAMQKIEVVNNFKNLSSPKVSPEHIPVSKLAETMASPTRTVTDAEKMRQERNQEAKMLIGSRVLEAKALFTQNTVQAPITTVKAPVKPIRKINMTNPRAPAEPIVTNERVVETKKWPIEVAETVPTEPEIAKDSDEQGDQFSTIKRSPHSIKTPSQDDTEPPAKMVEVAQAVVPESDHHAPAAQQSPAIEPVSAIDESTPDDSGLKARALYDYQAADESEITFDPGDVITHIDQIDEGWWQGLGPDGNYGLFPANYVELIYA